MAHPAPARRRCPVVPGYVLEELLGRGGTGEVWRARPRGSGPPVAVKVLLRGDPERQVREAALLAELDHPHLVRLLEVVRRRTPDGEQVALVLDLLAGGSLARLLAARGRLRPGEVVTAVAPVAAALAHVHQRGVVHGDVSPGNVVLTAEGRPVLTDLGVARLVGEPDHGEVTPPYVDPVVARGGAAGPASDVFGVAAAAFHALTGIPPWNAAGPGNTLAVAAAGQVPDLGLLAPEAPAALVAVVERGLSPHPHLRGTAAEFALDLRHACRPERIALPAPGVDVAELHRTDHVARTELTHQVRRASRAHAAPPSGGWPARAGAALRSGVVDRAQRARGAVGVAGPLLRRAGAALAVAVGVLSAVWVGVQWGAHDAGPVPAARTQPVGDATGSGSGAVPTDQPTGQPTGTAPATGGTRAPGSATPSGATPTSAAPSGTEVPSPGPAADTPQAPDDAAGWAVVVGQLYGRRAAAFDAGRSEWLADVYAPGCALADVDAERMAQLAAAGQHLEGFAPQVVSVDEVAPVAGGVQLLLTDQVPGYDVVGAGGRYAVAARGPRAVVMTVQATPSGWRIASAAFGP
ncbi:protein kinase [Klenkia sp. LSe6-5]|uniref:non-specific serine/threonine protein kinase n=1 Tax=Klenkia sesuvii TaxID=3103137 RepID=A0ABU8DTH0_9ACTN